MHILLDGSDCLGGDMIAETGERCGGLLGRLELGGKVGVRSLTG